MTADTVGGIWDYALELAHGLTREGTAVDLAVLGGPVPAGRLPTTGIPGLSIHEGRGRLEWMDGADEDFETIAAWLLDLEHASEPDVIHLNGYGHAALPWKAPTIVVGHSCVLSWWRAVHGTPAPDAWTPYARRVADGLRHADLVVTPTAAMGAMLERLYGAARRMTVIPNGRTPSVYRPMVKDAFVLSVGRIWDEAKNITALDLVAPDIAWPVMVAGEWRRPDGNGRPPGHLRCLGVLSQKDLARWYGRAPIFALPARYEPFGLSVLEAAMAGCALVLGNIPTLRELWSGAALFVEPDDREGLTRTLNGLIARPYTAAQLGRTARRRALRYTGERMTTAYRAAYADLFGSRAHHDGAATPSETETRP